MSITQEIKKGAFWVLFFSVIGGPIALLRNWLFTYYDPTGLYVADFAIVMILFNIITTFFVFGGTSVLTNFTPKIESREKRSSFLLSYSTVCILLFIILAVVLLLFPQSIVFLTNGRIGIEQNIYVVALAIPVLIAQILIYFLQGNLDYKSSSLLSQIPNFLNTLIVVLLILFQVPINNLKNSDSLIMFLSVIITTASVFCVVYGIVVLKKHISTSKLSFFVPKGFWVFSTHVHLMTLITFLYQNIDQLFVLKAIGVRELGFYFIIIQLVETVRFIPLKIGQVLLASFSKIVHTGGEKDLVDTYDKVSRIIVIINLSISVVLIVFSYFALNVFNILGSEYRSAFIFLLVGYNIAAIGNLNTMVLLAKELSRQFFINSILILAGLILALTFFSSYGFIGVVVAKVISIVIGQIGLFYLIRKHVSSKIGIDKNYIFSQLFLFILGIIAVFFAMDNILVILPILVICLLIIYKFYNISIREIRSLFKIRD